MLGIVMRIANSETWQYLTRDERGAKQASVLFTLIEIHGSRLALQSRG